MTLLLCLHFLGGLGRIVLWLPYSWLFKMILVECEKAISILSKQVCLMLVQSRKHFLLWLNRFIKNQQMSNKTALFLQQGKKKKTKKQQRISTELLICFRLLSTYSIYLTFQILIIYLSKKPPRSSASFSSSKLWKDLCPSLDLLKKNNKKKTPQTKSNIQMERIHLRHCY